MGFRVKANQEGGKPPSLIRRFSKKQRVEHWIVTILFFLLVVTGLPQRYYETYWAGWVVVFLGGLDFMHWVHRMAGLLFSGFMVYFLGYVSIDVLRGRRAATMVPFPADLVEIFRSLLWYVGLRERPRAPRFDYREKFEFWGMLMGSMVMVVTGLILYFPLQTARWLPGQFIPAAKTAHSYEALLAFLVIVIWHLYNTIFRPSVFPLDRAMIDGKIPVERLKEEHSLEYARLFPDEDEEPGDGQQEVGSEKVKGAYAPPGKIN